MCILRTVTTCTRSRSFGDTRVQIESLSLKLAALNLQEQKMLELPDAALLDCHYGLAEIINASDMAELIESHVRNWEDIKDCARGCLREDGGTDIGQFLSIGLWERAMS